MSGTHRRTGCRSRARTPRSGSPHVSGFVARYDDDCCTLFAENLRRYLDGAPLLNPVDRAKGY